ncbi:MAG TPA: DNA mismatch repair endonuclease MutL [Syntrophomonas sp.]|nr:DNA mismatch repair endonuclease MutL [Syntrophomonas sp.]HRW12508.1 DNA mismatch repair endonuclease MutL [Syntrophomonas sp.]
MSIKLLDDNLINQIAAGEVIERPSSVVKELVENAIDAGSTRIQVKISGGGLEVIEVEDNGCGIPESDIELALQRHATSKIALPDDLFNISTMGFRGEALPSIASIARLEVYSRQKDGIGAQLQLDGGTIISRQPYAGTEGTRIVVRELFYNTPVRKKFIKSTVAEQTHIYETISRLALSRPDISFLFASEKKMYFKTPGSGVLRDALIAINGKDYADHFIDFHVRGEKYSVAGLLSKPEFRRQNRKNQIFFVNRRLIKSPMLNRAVDEGYRGLLLAREYPGVILYLTAHCQEVDINVHPQKSEVRFRDESEIFRVVSRAIKDAVNGLAYTMGEAAWAERIAEPEAIFKPEVNPGRNGAYIPPPRAFEQSFTFVYPRDNQAAAGSPDRLADELPAQSPFRLIGQCFNAYLLVETEGRLWLIDQHAAHERIMYNQLRRQIAAAPVATQALAFPLGLDLSAAQIDMLEANRAVFERVGLYYDILGPDSIAIRSAPPALHGQESELLLEILEMIAAEQCPDIHDEAICMMACKQAIKANQLLSRAEMEKLVSELLQQENYLHCPHGRPSFMEISRSDLDRRFKR